MVVDMSDKSGVEISQSYYSSPRESVSFIKIAGATIPGEAYTVYLYSLPVPHCIHIML